MHWHHDRLIDWLITIIKHTDRLIDYHHLKSCWCLHIGCTVHLVVYILAQISACVCASTVFVSVGNHSLFTSICASMYMYLCPCGLDFVSVHPRLRESVKSAEKRSAYVSLCVTPPVQRIFRHPVQRHAWGCGQERPVFYGTYCTKLRCHCSKGAKNRRCW